MPFKPSAVSLKKASNSSSSWLARQYKDPYVRARLSNPANYRSRSAFKLLEVEARHGFLKDFLKEAQQSTTSHNVAAAGLSRRRLTRTFNIVDLGAAPGGWSQVIAAKLGLLGEDLEPQKPRIVVSSSSKVAWNDSVRRKGRRTTDTSSDNRLDEELEDMEKYLEGDGGCEWPFSRSQSRLSTPALRPTVQEAEFYNMDPLDYLNARDVDPVASRVTAIESKEVSPTQSIPINIVALDILPIRPIPGVYTLQMDFLKPDASDEVIALLARLNGHLAQGSRSPMTGLGQTEDGIDPSSESTASAAPLLPGHARVDMLLSDLSPPHTGNRMADVSHSVRLLRAVWNFARKTLKTGIEYHRERVRDDQWLRQDLEREGQTLEANLDQGRNTPLDTSTKGTQSSSRKQKPILRNGGILVVKHFHHPISTSFCRTFLNPYFSRILYFKPPSSRSESTEGYWICIGWKGVPDDVALDTLEADMQKHAEKLMQGEKEKERQEERQEEQRGREVAEAELEAQTARQ